jgi:hypothetical protein
MEGPELRQSFDDQENVQGVIGGAYAAALGLVVVGLMGRPGEL